MTDVVKDFSSGVKLIQVSPAQDGFTVVWANKITLSSWSVEIYFRGLQSVI